MVVLFFLSVLEFVSATRHTLVVIGSGTGSNLALGYEAPLEIERYVTDGAGRAVKLEPEERRLVLYMFSVPRRASGGFSSRKTDVS